MTGRCHGPLIGGKRQRRRGPANFARNDPKNIAEVESRYMLIFTVITMGILFLISFALGDIYYPIGVVALLMLIILGVFFSGRGLYTKQNFLIFLWVVLLVHRSFIPRVSLDEAEGLVFAEIGVTLFVLVASALTFILSLNQFRLRGLEARFWLLAYTALAAVSLFWSPNPVYCGFWVVRLLSVTLILVVYFQNATMEDCRKFFVATLIGSVPVLMLPLISYTALETTSQEGIGRVQGFWAHPGVVSIIAFSVVAGCLTVILQRGGGPLNRRFYFYIGLLTFAFASGFLAAGKTGAIGGALAITLMLVIGGRIRLWLGMVAAGAIGFAVFVFVLRDFEIGLLVHWDRYNFERLGTVHSRFDLWLAALGVWFDSIFSTFFGRGFASFRILPLESITGWAPGHAHNSFVTLMVDMGILGASTFVMILVKVFGNTFLVMARLGRGFSDTAAFPIFVTLVSLLAASVMDDVFGGTLQPTTYLTFGMIFALDRATQLLRASSFHPAPSPKLRLRPVAPPAIRPGHDLPAASD